MPNDQSNAEESEEPENQNQYGGDSEGDMDATEQTNRVDAGEKKEDEEMEDPDVEGEADEDADESA